MRRSPPLAIDMQPQPGVQACVAVIAALAAAGLAGWAQPHQDILWPLWLAVPVAAAMAWRAAAVQPRRLRWDGQAWWLADTPAAAETAVRLEVLIDLDHWLLLRAVPGPRWLPLSRNRQPQWGALRATLYGAPGGVPAR